MPHRVAGPGGGLVRVARGAWIGDFVFIRHHGRDERKRMRADIDVRDGHFDFRHVTW